MPLIDICVTERLTDEEKKNLIQTISDIVVEATGTPSQYHFIMVSDGNYGRFADVTGGKVAFIYMHYLAFTKENKAIMAKRFSEVFVARGYDSDKLHIIFFPLDAANYALRGEVQG